MASTANLRFRRSAAQLHALAGVEREIRAQDSHYRRKYLREFSQSFREYDCVLDPQRLDQAIQRADIVLIGDYHALPAAQHYAAAAVEQRALAGDRPVVLGVETIFARDQHILDEWWRREIDENELRQRIRFDIDWGYDWAPFREVLATARDHAEALYGLDCMPRDDLRRIGLRDCHASAKIVEMRRRHPNAVIFVLFGESHLAPGHLPQLLRDEMPEAKIVTVLQNVDALYWRAAGERANKVEAVRVNDDVVCVFNATPLEKYESYRLCLDQWSRAEDEPDFAPTIYNLIASLASFLEINRYSPHNGTQPKFLVDMLPEVYGRSSDGMLRRLLSRNGVNDHEFEAMLLRAEERGGAYLPEVNAFYMCELQMVNAAEDVAGFLHQACRGLPRNLNRNETSDDIHHANGLGEKRGAALPTSAAFHALVVENGLAYFGSKVLHPSTPALRGEGETWSFATYDRAAQAAARSENGKVGETAREWGQRLGSLLYDAYLAGRWSKTSLRKLFLAHLDEPEVARNVCATIISKTRRSCRSVRV
jgi:hypothetical protein